MSTKELYKLEARFTKLQLCKAKSRIKLKTLSSLLVLYVFFLDVSQSVELLVIQKPN